MVTDEEILKRYFQLNPQGMPAFTLNSFRQKENKADEFLIDDVPFNLDSLVEKYTKYLDWHTRKYGNDEKYVKAENKLLDPSDFIDKNAFYRVFGNKKDSRDVYLFGNFDEAELKDSLNAFLSKYNRAQRVKPKNIHAVISKSTTHEQEDFSIQDSAF